MPHCTSSYVLDVDILAAYESLNPFILSSLEMIMRYELTISTRVDQRGRDRTRRIKNMDIYRVELHSQPLSAK